MKKELALVLAQFCEANGLELKSRTELLTDCYKARPGYQRTEQEKWLEAFCALCNQSDEMGLTK